MTTARPAAVAAPAGDDKKIAKDASKLCFVIAPIGDADSDIRKRSDQILSYVITPAAKRCHLEAVRADMISEPGIITTQVIQHIIDDAMVVADLTGRNPNVFYELALRHALRKPYVQLIQRGERIPFDVAAVRTIEVDNRDLDSVEAAKDEIERQMQAMLASSKGVDSPISVAVDLELLRGSGNPEQRQLADVLASISELRTGVAGLEKRLTEPTAILPPGYLRDLMRSELVPYFHELMHRGRIHPGLVEGLEALRLDLAKLDATGKGPEKRFTEEEMTSIQRRLERAVAMLNDDQMRISRWR